MKLMNRPPQIKKRTAALIQVTVLLFLQVYSILSVFGHFVAPIRHGAVCRGDHRLCGCPLEKIATRTCCCFKSSEIAKSMMPHHKSQTMSIPKPDINHTTRFICPPCGDQPHFSFTSLEKIKFLRFAATSEGPDFLLAFFQSILGDTFQTRSNEPPDPPPKSITA